MDMYDEFVEPAELTGYGREALDEQTENQFTLARWLPDQDIRDLRYALDSGPTGLLDVADFRAYNAEPTFGRREGIRRIEGSLPPIGRQRTLLEYDQLILRDAEEEVRDLLLRDAERLAVEIGRRMELARADALVNASVTIGTEANPENGLALTVEFNRDPTHEVVAATLWSDPDALILDDLESWSETFRDSAGEDPESLLINRKIVRAMIRNLQVVGAVNGDNTGRRVTLAELNGLLDAEGLPQIYTYEARATVNRVTRRLIPEHKALLLPAPGATRTEEGGRVGATLWGTTVESQLPEYGVEAGAEPGIVVAAFIQRQTPVRVDTIGAAIGLPVVVDPDLTFVADVLAAA